MLKDIYCHERDSRIVFIEKDHKYIIDNQPEDIFISVTTLVKSFFPKFDADRVIDKLMRDPKKWALNKYFGKSKEEIKTEWKEKGDQSSSLGTQLHQTIENYYNQIQQNIPLIIQTEYEFFVRFQESISNDLIPYRTEWYVFDEEYKVAGSIDMIYKDHQGHYHIYDWKRTIDLKKTNPFQQGYYPFQDLDDTKFNHYSLQLNIYKYILEKNYGIVIDTMKLVCLHPLNSQFMIEPVPNLQHRIEKMFQYFRDNKEELLQNI